MKQKTYTYNELKGFINEELLNFNHIVESKHIFNAEFNKYKKFFKWITKKVSYVKDTEYNTELQKYVPIKRAIYPAFDTYTNYNGMYISLTKENVVDLDMTQLYKDFPNLKKYQELLLSLKPNVRSGKRPKNLEKDYEAERLRKAQEEDKATCGICHNYWEQVDMNGQKNIIADHGFFIGFGQRNNVCFGARYHAWEKSPESKIQYVKQILKPLLKDILKQKPEASAVEKAINRVVDYKKAHEEYTNLPNGMAYKYRQQVRDSGRYFTTYVQDDTCPEDIKKVHAIVKRMSKPSIIFTGQQVGEYLPLDTSKITLEL